MTIDILICSIDKGIVRTGDLLLPQRPDVRYIISYPVSYTHLTLPTIYSV